MRGARGEEGCARHERRECERHSCQARVFAEEEERARDRLAQNGGGRTAAQLSAQGRAGGEHAEDEPHDEVERKCAVAHESRGVIQCVGEKNGHERDEAEGGGCQQNDDRLAHRFEGGQACQSVELSECESHGRRIRLV